MGKNHVEISPSDRSSENIGQVFSIVNKSKLSEVKRQIFRVSRDDSSGANHDVT